MTSQKKLYTYPSAWIPFVLSLAALGLVIGHFMVFGIVHEADEGAAAHIFQILMALQVPIIAYFAVVWLPKFPKLGTRIVTVQVIAAIAAFAAVFFLT